MTAQPQKICVVFSLCNRDGALLLENLKWQTELDGRKGFTCYMGVETGTRTPLIKACTEEAKRSYAVVETFSYPQAPNRKWPNAPNWAFQHAARYMQRQKASWFWMEPDCIALGSGWLSAWNDRYHAAGKPIMGVVIPHMGHCNGTAIYPANFPALSQRAMVCTNIAWDGLMKDETIHLTADASDLMCHVWGIKDGKPMIGGGGQIAVFRTQADVDNWVNLKAVLFHRAKDVTLIARLRERRR